MKRGVVVPPGISQQTSERKVCCIFLSLFAAFHRESTEEPLFRKKKYSGRVANSAVKNPLHVGPRRRERSKKWVFSLFLLQSFFSLSPLLQNKWETEAPSSWYIRSLHVRDIITALYGLFLLRPHNMSANSADSSFFPHIFFWGHAARLSAEDAGGGLGREE